VNRWQQPRSLDEAKRAAWDQDDWDEGIAHCLGMIEKAMPATTYGTALDFGAGPARMTRPLQARHPQWRVVGYEPNRQMHDRDYYPMIAHLTMRPQYDVVYSTLVFQHLDAPDKLCALADIRRVLNDDGIFRLQFVNTSHGDATGPLSYPIDRNAMALITSWLGLALVDIEDDSKYPTWSWLTARKQPQ